MPVPPQYENDRPRKAMVCPTGVSRLCTKSRHKQESGCARTSRLCYLYFHDLQGCGHRAISFNSCRNRHCPKCQANARDRWLDARRRELLPTRYVHVVFTLPHQLVHLALQNKREIYSLLFRASAETLLTFARDPQHLGAEIGFFSVLHTWNQQLLHHPHVHCVVPRSEEHTSELQSLRHLVCRLL